MPKIQITKYESKHQPLILKRHFVRRVSLHFIVTLMLICGSLGLGMVGYHYFEGMDWIDSFANAAMILSGMGPLSPLRTPPGRLFAGIYALYSGLVLVVAMGIILSPFIHRLLHQFHAEVKES